MLGGLVEREAHLLARYPYTLASHLCNQLLAEDAPPALLDGPLRAIETRPWARLTNRIAGLSGQTAMRVLDHGGRVACLRWMRRGSCLVTAGEDGEVRLWDVATGRCLQVLGSDRRSLTDLDVSPDGDLLVAAGADGVLVYDLDRTDAKRYPARGARIAWAPDGSTVASAVGAAIEIWDPHSGEVLTRLEGERSIIGVLSWSPDGSRLASGTDGGTVRIWAPGRAESAEAILELGGLSYLRPLARAVTGLAWAPHGSSLAIAMRSGTVSFCEPNPWREAALLQVGDSWLGALAWSPGGRHLAVAHGNVIEVLDADRGRAVGSFARQSEWTRLAAHSPYAPPAAAAPVVTSFRGHTGAITGLAWAADGQTIASSSFDGSARLWNAASIERSPRAGRIDGSVQRAGVRRASSHPGTTAVSPLASESDADAVSRSGVGGEVGSFRELLSQHGEYISGYFRKPGAGARHVMALSPDGLWLATAAGVRDLRNEALIAELPAGKPLTTLAWSADGTRLALGREDGEICVRRVGATGPDSVIRDGWKDEGPGRSAPGFVDFGQYAGIGGHHVRLFDADYIPIDALAWSPDHHRLAAASRTLGFEIHDLGSGEASRFETASVNPTLRHLAWSPDGLLIASAEGESSQLAHQPFVIRVWDVDSGAARPVFEGDTAWSALAWAPDGSLLAFASADGAVRVWSQALDKTLLLAHGLSPLRLLNFDHEGSTRAASGPLYLCGVDDGAGTGDRPIPYVWKLCNFETEALRAEAERIEAVSGRQATRATGVRRRADHPDSSETVAVDASPAADSPLPPPRTWLDVVPPHQLPATPPPAAPEQIPQGSGSAAEIEERWDQAARLLERAQRELENRAPRAALPLLDEAEPLWRSLHDRENLARCLGGRAAALWQIDRPDLALEPLSESVTILRELARPETLADGLMLQAELLITVGDDGAASNCAMEAAAIFASLDRGVDEARARALLVRARVGRPTLLKGTAVLLLMLAPGGIGILLGLWNPWLWLLGVPLMVLSFFLFATAFSPGLRRAIERAASKM